MNLKSKFEQLEMGLMLLNVKSSCTNEYTVVFTLSQYEEARAELGAVQRELVGVREQVQGEARARERLTQELQTKVAQGFTLEGQLDSTRKLVQNLSQEVKR